MRTGEGAPLLASSGSGQASAPRHSSGASAPRARRIGGADGAVPSARWISVARASLDALLPLGLFVLLLLALRSGSSTAGVDITGNTP
mgnify:CR=1 FL=1